MSETTTESPSETAAGRRHAGRTGVFGSLCVMVFLVNIGRVIYAPLLEPFREAFGASAAAVGLLATLAWLGAAALQIPTGYLLTRFPRHWLILASGGLLAAGSVFAATARSLEVLSIGALCMGIASSAYFVAASPLVSELFPARVGRAIGVHGTSSQAAAVAAPLLVGAFFAVAWPVAAWRALFIAIALAAVASTAALFVAARRATLPTAGKLDRDLRAALRRQWPIVATGVAIVGVTALVWNGVFNFYVTYLVEVKGFPEGFARSVLTLLFLAGVPAFAITGWIADRVRFVPLLLSIVGAFLLALLALTVVEGTWAILAVTAVMGYVIHSIFPASDTYVLASVPDENRASAYALFTGVMMPLQAAGSAVLGFLVDAGVAFDAAFRLLALGVGVVLVGLVALYAAGRLPTGANGEPRASADAN
ncbi:MFS transporter [Natrinema salifodinae]|uniref:Predicted arabinose efflux permease, MFS family n=1 Tax=Natrinema salifodinae TaxID=1202768 RepID=A0A1I0Q4X7_9EURY|nr:MFS transporter [Natrinema salifodinae]SEW22019.1 Predicted arabinose efflux permease, MFS family [Natrinema salifodinae]